MLSCSCDYELDSPGAWAYYPPKDFTKLDTKRRKRCCSCGQLIDVGGECLNFQRERAAYTDIEVRISGEIVGMAPLYMCEACGEIFLNLDALHYCLDITKPMAGYLDEYHRLTGFKKEAAA